MRKYLLFVRPSVRPSVCAHIRKRKSHLAFVEVDEVALDDEALAALALVQLGVVDAHDVQLEGLLVRVVLRPELHVRQDLLRVVVVLDLDGPIRHMRNMVWVGKWPVAERWANVDELL